MEIRTIFFSWTLFCLTLSASPTARTEDSFMEFTLTGGPESHLFSQCIAESMTVEGNLYAISVSDDEDYERFAPDQTREIVWTDVELGENSNIIDCAIAAYDMKALMFKYDDGCSVTLTDSYNPAAEQSCADAAEVVYISSRVSAMNFFGDVPVEGDTFGCLTKSDDGWVYGVEDGRVVDEDTLPSRDSCCTSAASDYCLMAECTEEPMTYCEAEARCLARGLRAASRSFHESIDGVDQTKLGTDEYYFWVNVYQNQFSEWKWLDDESDFTDYEWCGGSSPTNNSTENCAAIHFTDAPHKIEYYRTACNGTEVKCILCYDADDVLPAC